MPHIIPFQLISWYSTPAATIFMTPQGRTPPPLSRLHLSALTITSYQHTTALYSELSQISLAPTCMNYTRCTNTVLHVQTPFHSRQLHKHSSFTTLEFDHFVRSNLDYLRPCIIKPIPSLHLQHCFFRISAHALLPGKLAALLSEFTFSF
jgi:hypothetical protein